MDLGILLVALGGVGITIQNGQTAIMSQKLSFFVSMLWIQCVQLIVTLIVWGIDSKFSLSGITEVPWYLYTIGVVNVIFVYLITKAVLEVGNAVSVGCMLSSQTIFNILVDELGMFGFPVRRNSILKSVGIALFVVSIAIVSIESKNGKKGRESSNVVKDSDMEKQTTAPKKRSRWVYFRAVLQALSSGILLGVMSGMLSNFAIYTSPPFAAVTSALQGILLSAIMIVIQWKDTHFQWDMPWWVKPNGILAAYFFVLVSYISPRYGAQVFFAIFNCCQVTSAVFADHFGLLGFKKPMGPWQVVGILGIIGSTALMSLF
jgi:transporter family-2 protein